jgi:hypothetical protein
MHVYAPRFRVGWIIISPGAFLALVESEEDPKTFVSRHLEGDWGDVSPGNWAENEYALKHGERVFSVYHTRHGRKLYVMTEANRYATTIFLPESEEGFDPKEASCERPRK